MEAIVSFDGVEEMIVIRGEARRGEARRWMVDVVEVQSTCVRKMMGSCPRQPEKWRWGEG